LDHWRKRQGNYKQYCCYFVILIFHVVNFLSLFLFLAFLDLSSLRTHFWPFTEVVRRIRREVTREIEREMNRGLRRQRELGKIGTTKIEMQRAGLNGRASAAADVHT
jgi:hypothetical protein